MTPTWFVIVGTCVLWLGWDIYVYEKGSANGGGEQGGNKNTLSVAIDWMNTHFKAAGVICGFILGHLFWQVHICP